MSQPTFESLYVVDTHALIWYLLGDSKLSKRAFTIFQAAENGETRLIIPAIVLAELFYANAKNRWFDDFSEVYNTLTNSPMFRFLAFRHSHVLEFDSDRSVPEMHDRMIAGVARRLDAPLITSDPYIQSSNVVRCEW